VGATALGGYTDRTSTFLGGAFSGLKFARLLETRMISLKGNNQHFFQPEKPDFNEKDQNLGTCPKIYQRHER
jgi:hypothetical protein